jgi:hypothetical protein
MKDITSTSFGYVIAYILPGMIGLYSLCPISPPVKELFKGFLTTNSSIGLFFIAALVSLAVGLQITALRWLIYELMFCRCRKLTADEFASLGVGSKLDAFRAAVDEHYRYHQFWGGMSIVLPGLYLMADGFLKISPQRNGCFLAASVLVELVTIAAAIVAYNRYITRSKQILKG